LSLTRLTRALEWPEFGGVLSGHFPGVVFADERIRVAGGIDIQAFSGRIRIADLEIERPFGTLPALAAQVELNRLDLLELTGAFNFGRMEGQMSGWMRDLRLLDWRPVAMDTRMFTHEDARRRRISQRAVDNLSSLGGGRWRPDQRHLAAGVRGFSLSPCRPGLPTVQQYLPHRRCGPHESGGFYIVEDGAAAAGHHRPPPPGRLAAADQPTRSWKRRRDKKTKGSARVQLSGKAKAKAKTKVIILAEHAKTQRKAKEFGIDF
jgi:hypothetical protein